ncbi:MAG: AtpZ/AtpI family protein [Dehalococcoidia bacterium]|nr:AtpZ/AtpI family protein [Dehalococcoidia bacterium]
MQQWQIALRVVGIGWYMALAILGGILGGLWLDGKLETEPVFLIVGILSGLVVAGYGAYQAFRPIVNNQLKGE